MHLLEAIVKACATLHRTECSPVPATMPDNLSSRIPLSTLDYLSLEVTFYLVKQKIIIIAIAAVLILRALLAIYLIMKSEGTEDPTGAIIIAFGGVMVATLLLSAEEKEKPS